MVTPVRQRSSTVASSAAPANGPPSGTGAAASRPLRCRDLCWRSTGVLVATQVVTAGVAYLGRTVAHMALEALDDITGPDPQDPCGTQRHQIADVAGLCAGLVIATICMVRGTRSLRREIQEFRAARARPRQAPSVQVRQVAVQGAHRTARRR